jgi:hypothetical protein
VVAARAAAGSPVVAAASDAAGAIPARPPGGIDLRQLLGPDARLPGAESGVEDGSLLAALAQDATSAGAEAPVQSASAATAAEIALSSGDPRLRDDVATAVTRRTPGRGTKSTPGTSPATKSAPGTGAATRAVPADDSAAAEGGTLASRGPTPRGTGTALPGSDPQTAAGRPDDGGAAPRSSETSARGRRAPAAAASRDATAAQEEAPVVKSRPALSPYAAPSGEDARGTRTVADLRPGATVAGRPLSAAETGAEAARPASFVTIPFTGEQGEAGRLRVSVLGSTVHATILTEDPQLAERLNRDLGDLRRMLVDRGYGAAQINVRAPSAGSGAAARDLGRDGERMPREDRGEDGSRRDERDPQRSQDRPRRPSQHPDPGGEKP